MADQDFGLFAVESAQIAPLVGKLDGYPTEDHQLSLQTTEHPVESGGSVTDNAVKLPDKLRLEGWVSDGLPAAGTDDATTPDQRRAETWQTIVTLMEQRELLAAVTLLKTYQNMIITSARTELNDIDGTRAQCHARAHRDHPRRHDGDALQSRAAYRDRRRTGQARWTAARKRRCRPGYRKRTAADG